MTRSHCKGKSCTMKGSLGPLRAGSQQSHVPPASEGMAVLCRPPTRFYISLSEEELGDIE